MLQISKKWTGCASVRRYKSRTLHSHSVVKRSTRHPHRYTPRPLTSLRMFFTLPTFLLSLVLSILASPVPLDVDATHTTTLSPRINHEGRGTFFFPGLGNCGGWNNNEDPIIAISTQIYGTGGNCGQWVLITNTDNGQTVYGRVQDSCPSCAPGSLDMSPAVFQQLAELSVGEIPIMWHYMQRGWSP